MKAIHPRLEKQTYLREENSLNEKNKYYKVHFFQDKSRTTIKVSQKHTLDENYTNIAFQKI